MMLAVRGYLWLGLAAALAGQDGGAGADTLLVRIKTHVAESLQRLPNYTCLETVERFERRGETKPLVLMDRVRLEVALVESKEFFAWPGEGKFDEDSITKLIPTGTIGNGNFALHAYSVFLSRVPVYSRPQETVHNGLAVIRYDYRVPFEDSGYTLRVPPLEARVGFHGYFLVDHGTLDLVRLEVVADDIPPHLGLEAAADAMEYSRVQIGDRDFTLPAFSELTLAKLGGAEGHNRTRFSDCRQFTGESVLRFDEASLLEPSVSATPVPQMELPAGTVLELVLDSGIESAKSAVGDMVTAKLRNNVKKDGVITIPKGALVTGRVTQLERMPAPYTHYEVRIHFFMLRQGAAGVEFSAMLEGVAAAGGMSTPNNNPLRVPYAGNQRNYILIRGDSLAPGVAPLVVTGERAEIPKGLLMLWRTRKK